MLILNTYIFSFGYSIEVENEDEDESKTINPPGLPEVLENKSDLISVIVKVAFQSSVGHASVNFLQFDYGCFSPNAPGVLKGPIPTEENKGNIYKYHIKDTLPGCEKSLEQAGAAFVLSEFSDDEVFLLSKDTKCPAKMLFTELDAKLVFEKFQERLQQIEDVINERNAKLKEQGGIPYEVLLPSRVPYGIAI